MCSVSSRSVDKEANHFSMSCRSGVAKESDFGSVPWNLDQIWVKLVARAYSTR